MVPVLWPQRGGKEGRRRDLLSKHAQGKNYEPEAALVELRMGYESARRNGATATGERWARPTLSALVSNNQRGRDSGVMGEGSVRERGERPYWAPQIQEDASGPSDA
jgi:hypothetical protein